MNTLRVNTPGREYNIYIDRGILKDTADFIKNVFSGEKIAVVTDTNVEPLYSGEVLKSLDKSGYKTKLITVPAGEKSKSVDMLNMLYNDMLDFGLTRTDLIIALGGGVVGDLTGYCAASLLRGIPYVQMPTTLLAQVDSSVGGKVAVNLEKGKNLVGAFNQPKAVIIDVDCLKTLSRRILCDGMAEVIKYGAIKDENLFKLLEIIKNDQELFANIDKIIYNCCDIKRQVVEEDEFDTGGRMVLNFGHTFGHAIEKKFRYEKYTHGEAVAVGMRMACELGERIGLTEQGTAARMLNILKQYDLPVSAELSHAELAEAVSVDKKGDGSHINLILLNKIGDVVIKKLKKQEFLDITI
ncbi:MAG TPA: 3-dehydroquinate synthase [Candidatus Monoglobus merdigallinarum]|uniref:3-dehydroquinate synthase n=1 Tax=Candidatus Monoglobus merdigallinarum TaxID=2838698 RepID=A0A9D1TLX8_9FIRM|nr:3-dehydroquinate synthase [Candidatus Monoglobus merdigallinarum]